jgi:hypothetical protein
MEIKVLASAEAVARAGAAIIAAEARAAVAARLGDGDRSIPAGRIDRDNALVCAERAAAGQLEAN